MRIFWKKLQNSLQCRGLRPQTSHITPIYYYYFVEFVSSVKCVLLPSKKNKIAAVNVLLFLLSHLRTYFSLQIL